MVEDLMVRRTSLFYWDATGGVSHLDAISVELASLLGWTDERVAQADAQRPGGPAPSLTTAGRIPTVDRACRDPTHRWSSLVETLVGTPRVQGFRQAQPASVDKLKPAASTSSTNGEWWEAITEGTPQALGAGPLQFDRGTPAAAKPSNRIAPSTARSSGRPVQVAIVATGEPVPGGDRPRPCIWRTPRPARFHRNSRTGEVPDTDVDHAGQHERGHIGVGHLHITAGPAEAELGQGQRPGGRTTRCRWPPGPGSTGALALLSTTSRPGS